MQALNVARGGTLHQHLPDVVGNRLEHRQPEPGSVTTHHVETAPHSRLRASLGGPKLEVNSFHHQAVQTLGRNLVATAWAGDGTIEAVENLGDRFVLGVQWHAEGLKDHDVLFDLLIAAAAGAEDYAEDRVAATANLPEPRRLGTAARRPARSRRPPDSQRLAEAS
jgi:putative glutamine amidotransferase